MNPATAPPRHLQSPGKVEMLARSVREQRIEAHEYVKLVLSNRRLVRADDGDRQVLGLLDPIAGVRYVIAEKHLFGG